MDHVFHIAIFLLAKTVSALQANRNNSWKDKSSYLQCKPNQTPNKREPSINASQLPFKISEPRRLRDRVKIIAAGQSGIHMALGLKKKALLFRNTVGSSMAMSTKVTDLDQ